MQAVCAKCSRLMCRAVVLFLVAECAQTTPMIAPLPGDPNFSIDGSVAFFKSGESNPTQPNPPRAGRPPASLPDVFSRISTDLSSRASPGRRSPPRARRRLPPKATRAVADMLRARPPPPPPPKQAASDAACAPPPPDPVADSWPAASPSQSTLPPRRQNSRASTEET